MKASKIVILPAFLALSLCFEVNAQTQDEKAPVSPTPEVNIPESYNQAQNQIETEAPAGTSTYNLAETETQPDPGAASWRSESEVEVLRIYSGSHDGNNVIKTVEVRVPVRDGGSNYSRSEYIPK